MQVGRSGSANTSVNLKSCNRSTQPEESEGVEVGTLPTEVEEEQVDAVQPFQGPGWWALRAQSPDQAKFRSK